MRAWQKGAIVGGVWGLLAWPIYWVIGMLSLIFNHILHITPLIKEILNIILFLPYTVIVYFGGSDVLAFIFNVAGWAFIGAIIGYLMD